MEGSAVTRRTVGEPTMERRMTTPRLVALLLGSVLLVACGTDPKEEPLTKDEALILFEGIGKTLDDGDVVGAVEDTGTATIQCSGGGMAAVSGKVAETDPRGDTVGLEMDVTVAPSGCKLATTPVIEIDGDPNVRWRVAMEIVGFFEEVDIDGSITGGVEWKLGGRAGPKALGGHRFGGRGGCGDLHGEALRPRRGDRGDGGGVAGVSCREHMLLATAVPRCRAFRQGEGRPSSWLGLSGDLGFCRRRGHRTGWADREPVIPVRENTIPKENTMLKRLWLLVVLALPVGVEAQTKKVWGAAILEAVIPVSGHAYAGDAGAGLVPAAVFAGGLGLYVAGAYQWTGDFAEALGCILPDPSCRDGEDDSRGGDVLAVLGVAAIVGGKIWGVWSSVDAAKRFNVSIRPSKAGVEAAVRLSLRNLRPAKQYASAGVPMFRRGVTPVPDRWKQQTTWRIACGAVWRGFGCRLPRAGVCRRDDTLFLPIGSPSRLSSRAKLGFQPAGCPIGPGVHN